MSELAPSEVVELLDVDATVEKRAQWKAFEFTFLGDGDVEVVNTSHDEPSDHSYTVHVESGIPTHCPCPAWEYQEGACKHIVAVAIREPLLEVVSVKSTIRLDGGVMIKTGDIDHSDERPDDCGCAPMVGDLSCWPCYREGFEEPNPNRIK